MSKLIRHLFFNHSYPLLGGAHDPDMILTLPIELICFVSAWSYILGVNRQQRQQGRRDLGVLSAVCDVRVVVFALAVGYGIIFLRE